MEPPKKKKRGLGWSQRDMENALEELRNSQISDLYVGLI